MREENKEIIIDWSKFKVKAKGGQLTRSKNNYIEFCKMLDEVDFELVSDYIGSQEKVELLYRYSDIKLNTRVDGFKNSIYKSINNFKNKAKENGDKFIKFIGLTDRKVLISKIKTYDGGIVEISVSNYDSWNRGRQDFYDKLKEVNGYTDEFYKGNNSKINIFIDNVKLNPVTTIGFRSSIYNSILNFKRIIQQENKYDKFIKFTSVNSDGILIAQIKTSFNKFSKIMEKDINSYCREGKTSFRTNRKSTYDYCEEKGYKVLSPYINTTEKMLIDFNCGHDPHWSSPIHFTRGVICPECGYKIAVYKNSGKNNYRWKGAVALSKHLRKQMVRSQWYKDSFAQTGGKCVISGKKRNLHLHHVYPLSKIIDETLESLNLDIREKVDMYSNEELQQLENKCLELHYKYGLGVPLAEELHTYFHKTYGYENNTREQFEEFKRKQTSLLF